MAAATLNAPGASFDEFLAAEEAKDLLRFTTAGSVDDGKSTMIGRLLYDSRNVFEDQLESVTKASAGRNAGPIDFSLLTDGLRAEREQGITIDVAYRYFATPKRKFIIADTPGHEQYTRNMVTGASTAELAIILVDARKGLLPQSRRHAYISSLLGLQHLVIAVNKMDLVDYDESVFNKIEADFRQFLSRFQSIEPYFIPISALAGDNVVVRGENTPWFHGATLLEHLESVPAGPRAEHAMFRLPVQRIVRPDLDFRGYAGQIASGAVRPGDPVTIIPSGRTTRVKSIVTFDGELNEARAPQSVTLTLEDEIDIVRGDLISSENAVPAVSRVFDSTVVWFDEQPLDPQKRYRLKHTSHQQWAEVKAIHYRLNINTLDHESADTLEMNAIGSLRIEAARPIYFDSYRRNRGTGNFILIDPVTNATVAAGMIAGAVEEAHAKPRDHAERLKSGPVTPGERTVRYGHRGAVIHLGNRVDLVERLERRLFDRGSTVLVLEKWSESWRGALKNAGLLVIVADGNSADFFLQTFDGDIARELNDLPDDDQEAVEIIYRLLERLQILLGTQSWSESAGI
jgi:sulfate adenylyltransferase large subunit